MPNSPRPSARVPGPQRPVRPVVPAARPVAPVARVPRVVRPASRGSSGGGSGGIITILILLVTGVAVWWQFSRKPAPVAPAPVHVPAPVEPSRPAPEPVAAPKPVVKAPAEPAPMAVEPAAPMPATPPPTAPEPVAPAAPVEPDAFAQILTLDAVAARSPAAEQRAARALRYAAEKNEWPRYLELLQKSLAAELGKSPDFSTIARYERYLANAYFMRAMLQHAFIGIVGSDARRLIAEDDLVRQHTLWVCESQEAMESFLRARSAGDNVRAALDTWARLAADDAEALGKYRELAIACSLVFEKPKNFDWNGDRVNVTAEQRYRWYKAKDKAGQLVGRITAMSAWQLAWVVGVPVPESEMEWSLQELARKLKQRDWGRAYGMVPYDMEKAVTGKMKEPYEYYTFAEILKKGGVCGDRAYFAANAARAAGIPALTVSGDGPRGPHAWITWMADDDRWAFSGRFGGYPAGTVRDPRDGTKMSEQKFNRLSEARAPSEATKLKAQRLVWLQELHLLLGQPAHAETALEFALRTSPRQAELWEKKVALWKQQSPPREPAVWKTFLDALKREFRDDSDLLAMARQAEDTYVLAKVDAATAKNELRGDIRDLGKLKGLTSLQEIRTAHERFAVLFLESKDYAALRRIYREALDDYGREPAKFKGLAQDYWKFAGTAPQDIRLTACRDIEGAFERHVESKSGDFFDVNSQSSAAKLVAKCWREAGDAARADRIEKQIAARQKKATKNAL